MRGSTSSLARNVLQSAVANGVPPLATLAAAPLLARGLGVDGRGELAAAVAPMVLLLSAGTLGLPEAVTYAVARSPERARRLARAAVGCLVVAGLVCTAAVALASQWLAGSDAELRRLVLIASLAIVPGLVVAGLRGAAAGLGLWGLVNAEKTSAALGRLAVIVVLLLGGWLTPVTATVAYAVTPVAAGLAYLGLGRRTGPLDPGGAGASSLLRYGSLVWIGSLSGILLTRVDQLLMVPLSGVAALGLYVAAVNVADVPLITNTAVREVLFARDAADPSVDRLQAAARISTAAAVAVALCLALAAPLLVPLVFGEAFAPAVPVVLVLLLACVVGIPGSVAGAGLSARGRPGLRSGALLAGCLLNVALVLLLVPEHGATGAAWATLVGNGTAGAVNTVQFRRRFGDSYAALVVLRRSDVRFVREQLLSVVGRR